MAKKILVIVGVVVLVAAAAVGGFFYGKSQGASQATAGMPGAPAGIGRQGQDGQQFDPSQLPQGGNGGAQSGRGFAGGSFGTIESVDNGIITVRLQDNSTMQVRTTDTTLIEKNMEVSVQELQKGDTISVSGSKGDDGITIARSIRVMSMPAGGQGNPPADAPGDQTGGTR